MTGPREVVQTAVPSAAWTPAAAWLLGYVRTDAPGYREIDLGSVNIVAAAGDLRFDAWVAALDAASLAVNGDNITWSTSGQVQFSGEFTYLDRSGWMAGLGVEAGQVGLNTSVVVPPAGIPLIGATWTQVIDDADRRQLLDRHRRSQGYVWGSALLWRCKLVMHRYALEALQTGWCLRGKVTLGCADMLDTPISSTEPRGAITGYALGLDGVSWLDSIQQNARVEMTIVTS